MDCGQKLCWETWETEIVLQITESRQWFSFTTRLQTSRKCWNWQTTWPILTSYVKNSSSIPRFLTIILRLMFLTSLSKMMWTNQKTPCFLLSLLQRELYPSFQSQTFKDKEFCWNQSYIKPQNSASKCYENLGRSKQQVYQSWQILERTCEC